MTSSRKLRAALLGLVLGTLLAGCSSAPNTSSQPGALVGSVRLANREAAFGARVETRYLPLPPATTPAAWRNVNATGEFDFGMIESGVWLVTTNFGLDASSADSVVVQSGRITSYTVTLAPGAVLRGTVLLSGAVVHPDIELHTVFPSSLTHTLPSGAFEMRGLAPGHWPVWVSRSGYRDSTFMIVVHAAAETVRADAAFILFPDSLDSSP